MPAKLFVGNLSFQATEEDLRELFQQAGTVESVRIVTDQFTGRPRGFGFVEMATKEELAKAIEMLNGRLFRDRNLVVDEARPQPQRSGGGGGPRGGGGGGRPGGGGGGGGWRRYAALTTPGKARRFPGGFSRARVLVMWRALEEAAHG
jgi:RNA recognition motif-containing protein